MQSKIQELTIIRPDDFHLHIRDSDILSFVLPHTAKVFKRAIIMPNLKPPVVTVDDVIAYKERIMANCAGTGFEPLMTIYLTQSHTPADIEAIAKSGLVSAIKLYPAGATTNSQNGVSDIGAMADVFAAMAEHKIPLLLHGEVTHKDVDVFDREKRFIDDILIPKILTAKGLKVVMEHITTKDAVDFVNETDIAATITPQHLLMNRNAIFEGGINPHNYCLPILKRETHRQALLGAIKSGSKKFFLGTDSAPHPKGDKESSCGCAGIYTAFAALPLYLEAFEEVDAVEHFEAFCSKNGADYYGLPRNTETVTLVREPWIAPAEFNVNDKICIVPIRAGKEINWRVK